MNSQGILVFDVNDFDEAYVGPFTWDLKRLCASLSLLGYQKAMSDAEIRRMIETLTRSYIAQVAKFARSESTQGFALTLNNTDGKLLEVLQKARLNTRIGVLEENTVIDNYERRFATNDKVRRVTTKNAPKSSKRSTGI